MKVRLLGVAVVLAAAGNVFLFARWGGVVRHASYWRHVLELGIPAMSLWWAAVQHQRRKASGAPKR